jgi:hypothetical protein
MYWRKFMAIVGVFVIVCVVIGVLLAAKEKPNDSTAGRWGVKAGKFTRVTGVGKLGGRNLKRKNKTP